MLSFLGGFLGAFAGMIVLGCIMCHGADDEQNAPEDKEEQLRIDDE